VRSCDYDKVVSSVSGGLFPATAATRLIVPEMATPSESAARRSGPPARAGAAPDHAHAGGPRLACGGGGLRSDIRGAARRSRRHCRHLPRDGHGARRASRNHGRGREVADPPASSSHGCPGPSTSAAATTAAPIHLVSIADPPRNRPPRDPSVPPTLSNVTIGVEPGWAPFRESPIRRRKSPDSSTGFQEFARIGER